MCVYTGDHAPKTTPKHQGFSKAVASAHPWGTDSRTWLASATCWPLIKMHQRRRLFSSLPHAFVSFWEELIMDFIDLLARAAWLTPPLSRADSKPKMSSGKLPGPASYDFSAFYMY